MWKGTVPLPYFTAIKSDRGVVIGQPKIRSAKTGRIQVAA
jgi:hypothetical protein